MTASKGAHPVMAAETPAKSDSETLDGDAVAPMRGATALLSDILDDLDRQYAVRSATSLPETAAPAGANENPDRAEAKAKATLGDVLDRLDERAFGFLLLLLALPCCLPFVYLLPQIVSLPMLALAGQLAAGKQHPWFPAKLKSRKFAIADFRNVLARSGRYVGWVERIARPRLRFVTGPTGARIVGALMLAPTASIMVPLPSTNTVPGIGVAITSLGLIERDGLLVIAGLVIGFLWIGLLLFFGVEAASIIKAFIQSRI